MNKHYGTAAGFRQALEDRIRTEAGKRSVPINDLRQKLMMERPGTPAMTSARRTAIG